MIFGNISSLSEKEMKMIRVSVMGGGGGGGRGLGEHENSVGAFVIVQMSSVRRSVSTTGF